MRGSLTFRITLNQEIECQADLHELTDFDLIRLATALTEQAFKFQMSLIAKKVNEAKQKKIIQDASIESFKKKVDGSSA